MTLDEWAKLWALPPVALEQLQEITRASSDSSSSKSEEAVASECRLVEGRLGIISMRNNVGALKNENGRVIRYGLMNESAERNAHFKSSDRILIIPHIVQPNDVGRKFGVFGAIEHKRRDWKFTGTPRELAQANFHRMVESAGGVGLFANSSQCLIDKIVSRGLVLPATVK